MSKNSKELIEEIGPEPIENLAFEGGGVKGLVYVGALHELQGRGVLKDVKRVGGSSAGGITAMLVGLGYSVEEITKEMMDLEFTNFQDTAKGEEFWKNLPEGAFRDKVKMAEIIITILNSEKKGFYKGDVFLKWAENKIAQKFSMLATKIGKDPKDATFADLKIAIDADPQNKLGFKDMMFTASNISGNGPPLQVFSADTTPNVRIADAVRATMAYPLAFEPYEIEIRRGNEKEGEGVKSVFLDGGMLNNFPTDQYDDQRYLPKGKHLNALGMNLRTLGIRVDNEKEIALYKWSGRERKGRDVSTIRGFLSGVKEAFLVDREKVRKAGFNVIQIPDKGISTLKFELTPQDKEALVTSGIEATNQYFKLYRDDALSEVKKYKKLREFYEGKPQDELLAIQKKLQEEIDKLFVKKNSDLLLAGLSSKEDVKGLVEKKDALEFEENSKIVQKKINEVTRQLTIVEEALSRFDKKQNVEAVLDHFNSLIDIQTQQAKQSCAALESFLNKSRELNSRFKNMVKGAEERLTLLEKVKKDQHASTALKKSLDAVIALHGDRSNKLAKISKLNLSISEIEKGLTPLERSANPKKAEELNKLQEELDKQKKSLSDIYTRKDEIFSNLKQELKKTSLGPEEKTMINSIVNEEGMKIESKDENQHPLDFEEYIQNLESEKLELEQKLKKINEDRILENTEKAIEDQKTILWNMEVKRNVVRDNPSKMAKMSNELDRLIKTQHGNVLTDLKNFVFGLFELATGYFIAKAVLSEFASLDTYKKYIIDFERKFNTRSEDFIEKARELQKEIEKTKQSLFQEDEKPSERIVEYMALLDKAAELAVKLPVYMQKNYQAFVKDERRRAQEELGRLARLEKRNWEIHGIQGIGLRKPEKKQEQEEEKSHLDEKHRQDQPRSNPPPRPRPGPGGGPSSGSGGNKQT